MTERKVSLTSEKLNKWESDAKNNDLPIEILAKGSARNIATNPLTQLCQTAFQYVFDGVVNKYNAQHAGAGRLAKVLACDESAEGLNSENLDTLFSGLLATRLTPSRNMLISAMLYNELSAAQKASMLLLNYPDEKLRTAHESLFDALGKYVGSVMIVNKAEAKRKRSKSVTFADTAFSAKKRAKKVRGASLDDLK